ncbi:MAG: lanthionine synthetase LanC family protein [Pseudonocardiaceae bacterium]
MPGPPGHHRSLPGVEQRGDVGRGSQVALRDHLRLALHPGHLPQVPVRLPVDHLLVQARHTLGHTIFQDRKHRDTPEAQVTAATQASYIIKIELSRKLGLEAADTLCRVVVLDDGAAWWPAGPAEGNLLTYWCSGSSGIGSFLLRAWQVSREPQYAELAEQAALAVYRTRWLDLPSVCHGLAGNGEFLLDAAGILGKRRFAEQASELVAVAYLRHSLRSGRMVTCGENGRDVVADAGVGMSGMVQFLLRCRDGGARSWMVDEVFAPRQALRACEAVA